MSWQILALRYGTNAARTRRDSFLFDPDPDAPHPMEFFFWVLRRGDEVVVVDTGMDGTEGARRRRPILTEPAEMLARAGIDPADVRTLVLTHLHFDHAGALDLFPNATVHLQSAELAFATGAMMANPALSMPYSIGHVADVVRMLYQGRVRLHEGAVTLAKGVVGHLVGGHSAGLMALEVVTARGVLVLASDVAHYYEQLFRRPIFQIVVDPPAMVRGYDFLWERAGTIDKILPSHDPLIRQAYPEIAPDIFDLSAEPRIDFNAVLG